MYCLYLLQLEIIAENHWTDHVFPLNIAGMWGGLDMWKFFKGIVFHIFPVFVVSSAVVLLFFLKIPTVFEFLYIALVLTVLFILALAGIYYAYENIKKLIRRLLYGKTVSQWEIRDLQDIMLMNAVDPDHPSLQRLRREMREKAMENENNDDG